MQELVDLAGRKAQLTTAAKLIVTRRPEAKTYEEIADECGPAKFRVENCDRIARLMEDAGLPEPCRRAWCCMPRDRHEGWRRTSGGTG